MSGFNFTRKGGEALSKCVALAREGDKKAIRELYEGTAKDVYFVAKKYIRDEQDVFDVLQDAYVVAFSKLSQLEDDDKFVQWLNCIVANKAKDYLKKKKPLLFSEIMKEDQNVEEFVADNSRQFRPKDAYNYEELKTMVSMIIDELSEENRLCILMFYFQQLSISEIAAILDISPNTVKSRLGYGRKQIKHKIERAEAKGVVFRGVAPLSILVYVLKDMASEEVIPKVLSKAIIAAIGGGSILTIAGITITSSALLKTVVGVAATAVLATTGIVVSNALKEEPKEEVVIETPPSPVEEDDNGGETTLPIQSESEWRIEPMYQLEERPIALYDKGFLIGEANKTAFVDIDNTVLMERNEKYRVCMGYNSFAFVSQSGPLKIENISDLLQIPNYENGVCEGGGAVMAVPVYFSDKNQVLIYGSWDKQNQKQVMEWIPYKSKAEKLTEIITVDAEDYNDPLIAFNPQGYIVFRNNAPISTNIYDEVRVATYWKELAEAQSIRKLGALKKANKWKLINEEGWNLTKSIYDDMEILNDQYALFRLNGEVGLLNDKGEVVFQGKYEDVSAPIHNVVMVKKDGLWGFMNLK